MLVCGGRDLLLTCWVVCAERFRRRSDCHESGAVGSLSLMGVRSGVRTFVDGDGT